MTHYICIHGHFYQPPRENPWLEEVEAQESAHPFHDWNERVAHECYTPNTHARILDEKGRLVDLINNYEFMSFNIGPTLLAWLERHAADTYEAILEADASSRKARSGHGNAIAQPYNHMIMPLASSRDKITQVAWGIEDFRDRFQRDPEGMWLPETAVDTATLGVLADHGIAFTILAPGQARRFRVSSTDEWVDLNPNSLDPSRPYLFRLPNGRSITIFFYDGPLSHAIAFEQLLNSGDSFRSRLISAFSDTRTWPQLVNIATDGESFGHHHRFGEMALAWVVSHLLQEPDVELTNYSEFLEKHPPSAEVEIQENSSWSCAHGVGRWSRDCGCSLSRKPGWNQKWRGPLRKALDLVRDRAAEIFVTEAGPLLRDPWKARDVYISVILHDHENVDEFLAGQSVGTLDRAQSRLALRLLEMQRNGMLMYTSCGWFFDDISGIESLQILRYAARLLQLAEPFDKGLKDKFLKELGRAKSNVKPYSTADKIFENRIAPMITDLSRVAAHVAISGLVGDLPARGRQFCYHIELKDAAREMSGDWIMLVGHMLLSDRITLDSQEVIYTVLHLGGVDIRCSVKGFEGSEEYDSIKTDLWETFFDYSATALIHKLDKLFPERYFSLLDLFVEERSKLLQMVTERMYEAQAGRFEAFYTRNKGVARFIAENEAPVPDIFLSAAGLALRRIFLSELQKLAQGIYPDRLESVLEEKRLWNISPDISSAEKVIRESILKSVRRIGQEPDDQVPVEEILRLLELCDAQEIPVDLGEAQILLFRTALSVLETRPGPLPNGFLQLAERLQVKLPNGD
jgi:alpha-amylase/alpha-mannosidase (GH57 family)